MTCKSLSLKLYALLLTTIFYTAHSFAADYYVNKGGNDSNGCANATTDACLTINHALRIGLQPGDNVNVGAGTYIETADTKNSCIWLDGDLVSLCLESDKVNGTPGNPITLQVDSGSEGKVIIDSQLKRIGLQIQNNDYIQVKGFRFINNYIAGITSWGQVPNHAADESRLSIGVVLEDNFIYNTNGPHGKNIAGIHMWGSKDWVVKNNIVNHVTKDNEISISHTSGIQAYGTINATVENNLILNASSGILWKDHFVVDTDPSNPPNAFGETDVQGRAPLQESTVQFNTIANVVNGIHINARGALTPEAGNNDFNNNIIFNYTEAGIIANISHAFAQSARINIKNNILDGYGNSQSVGISIDAFVDTNIEGNIIIRNKDDILLIKEGINFAKLNSSDRNVFEANSVHIVMDRFSSTTQKDYNTLAEWQAAVAADTESLNFNSPDANSIEATSSALFENINNGKYIYTAGSPANNLMADNSNAGAHQTGTENIGVTSTTFVLPEPMTSFKQK